MRYELRANAYDLLDRVTCTVSVRGSDDLGPAPAEWVVIAATTVEGTGEDDVHQWARDALIALLEAL